MSQPITILVGTMTGTAELVAQEVEPMLQSAGFDASTLAMDGLDHSVFDRGGIFLICTSTYGNGDVPDNAQSLFTGLEEHRPDLASVVYGVIALGDITYKATFCHGGQRFDTLLTELGARRVGTIMQHDASSGTMPEDLAVEWAEGWARELAALKEAA